MPKAIFVASLFGVCHAGISLLLIPWSNAAFQQWFDSGSPQTFAERIGYLVSLLLSFPAGIWILFSHPARVSAAALITSTMINSLIWALCVYFVIVWFRRRTTPNDGMQPD